MASLHSAFTPPWQSPAVPVLDATVSVCSCVGHLGVSRRSVSWCYRSALTLTIFLSCHFQSCLMPEGNCLMDISNLWLSLPKSLILFTLSNYGSLYCSHVHQEDTSLIMADKGLVLSIAECYLESFYDRKVISAFLLCTWTLWSWVLGHSRSIRIGFYVME